MAEPSAAAADACVSGGGAINAAAGGGGGYRREATSTPAGPEDEGSTGQAAATGEWSAPGPAADGGGHPPAYVAGVGCGKRRRISKMSQLENGAAAAHPPRQHAWQLTPPGGAAVSSPPVFLRTTAVDHAAWYLLAAHAAAHATPPSLPDADETTRHMHTLVDHALYNLRELKSTPSMTVAALASDATPAAPAPWLVAQEALRLLRAVCVACRGAGAHAVAAALSACTAAAGGSDWHLRALGVLLGDRRGEHATSSDDASDVLGAVGPDAVRSVLAGLVEDWRRAHAVAATEELFRVTYALRAVWRRCPRLARPDGFLAHLSQRILAPHVRPALVLTDHAPAHAADPAPATHTSVHADAPGAWLMCATRAPPLPPPAADGDGDGGSTARWRLPLAVCFLLLETEKA